MRSPSTAVHADIPSSRCYLAYAMFIHCRVWRCRCFWLRCRLKKVMLAPSPPPPPPPRPVAFIKMHGLRNDYVYLDGFMATTEDGPFTAEACTAALLAPDALDDAAGNALSALAVRVCPRDGSSVGADGVIWIGPLVSHSDGAVAAMRMFNADGSEARMCGNGLRCASRIAAWRLGISPETTFGVLTLSGVLQVVVHGDPALSGDTTITFPTAPKVGDLEAISLTLAPAPQHGGDDAVIHGVAVNVGNPHFVILCRAQASVDPPGTPFCLLAAPEDIRGGDKEEDSSWKLTVKAVGRALEHHERFAPDRTNVELVTVDRATRTLKQWTWERGSGETFACGTGACAAAAAAVRLGWIDASASEVLVRLRGGDLKVSWAGGDKDALTMRGPAVYVYRGLI